VCFFLLPIIVHPQISSAVVFIISWKILHVSSMSRISPSSVSSCLVFSHSWHLKLFSLSLGTLTLTFLYVTPFPFLFYFIIFFWALNLVSTISDMCCVFSSACWNTVMSIGFLKVK
jgi:hypothetical protein